MTTWERAGSGDSRATERRRATRRVGFLARLFKREPKKPAFGDWPREVETDPRVEAAIAIGAAWAVRRIGQKEFGELDAMRCERLARLIESIWRLWRRFPGRTRRILWVDHQPEASHYERRALEALGIEIQAAASTSDALRLADEREISTIVTNFARPEEPRAALGMMESFRGAKKSVPVIIYDSLTDIERADAQRHGVLDATNNPQELLRLVTQALLIYLSRTLD